MRLRLDAVLIALVVIGTVLVGCATPVSPSRPWSVRAHEIAHTDAWVNGDVDVAVPVEAAPASAGTPTTAEVRLTRVVGACAALGGCQQEDIAPIAVPAGTALVHCSGSGGCDSGMTYTTTAAGHIPATPVIDCLGTFVGSARCVEGDQVRVAATDPGSAHLPDGARLVGTVDGHEVTGVVVAGSVARGGAAGTAHEAVFAAAVDDLLTRAGVMRPADREVGTTFQGRVTWSTTDGELTGRFAGRVEVHLLDDGEVRRRLVRDEMFATGGELDVTSVSWTPVYPRLRSDGSVYNGRPLVDATGVARPYEGVSR